MVPFHAAPTPASALRLLRSGWCSKLLGPALAAQTNRLLLAEIADVPVQLHSHEALNMSVTRGLIATLENLHCGPQVDETQESLLEGIYAKTAHVMFMLTNRVAGSRGACHNGKCGRSHRDTFIQQLQQILQLFQLLQWKRRMDKEPGFEPHCLAEMAGVVMGADKPLEMDKWIELIKDTLCRLLKVDVPNRLILQAMSPMVPFHAAPTPASALHLLRSGWCSKPLGPALAAQTNRLLLAENVDVPVQLHPDEASSLSVREQLDSHSGELALWPTSR